MEAADVRGLSGYKRENARLKKLLTNRDLEINAMLGKLLGAAVQWPAAGHLRGCGVS